MDNERGLLSIGALSKATGVPADTLRTWERRYGFPSAMRTQSGHRRYSSHTLEQLHMVTAALALGHRPASVLSASLHELEVMLGRQLPAKEAGRAAISPDVPASPLDLTEWFERVEAFEGRAFERVLRSTYSALGALDFMERAVAPFLQELGARWADGTLGVRHEHFASERLREFLSAQWRPLSDSATGPTHVLACPAGEHHVLGLQLVAMTVAISGGRVVLLGANTPAAEVADAAIYQSAEAVLLSTAIGMDQARLQAELAELLRLLPESVPLLVGGKGYSNSLEAVIHLERLRDLEAWLSARAER